MPIWLYIVELFLAAGQANLTLFFFLLFKTHLVVKKVVIDFVCKDLCWIS